MLLPERRGVCQAIKINLRRRLLPAHKIAKEHDTKTILTRFKL